MTEDEMVGWHHQLNGHEFEQTQGDGEGQGSLACCSLWGRKESDMTERLNNNKIPTGFQISHVDYTWPWFGSMVYYPSCLECISHSIFISSSAITVQFGERMVILIFHGTWNYANGT